MIWMSSQSRPQKKTKRALKKIWHYCRFWSSSGIWWTKKKRERSFSFLKRKDRSIDFSKHFVCRGKNVIKTHVVKTQNVVLEKQKKKKSETSPPKIKKSIHNRTKVFSSSSSFVFLLGQTKTTTTTLYNIYFGLLFRRRRGCCCCGKNDDQKKHQQHKNKRTHTEFV